MARSASAGPLALLAAALGAMGAGGLRQGREAAARYGLVEPGEWLTDGGGRFLVLPLALPEGLPADRCKVLADGDRLMVMVTEQPAATVESGALRKYKLVIEALKRETGHDEHALKDKLQEWLETEEDDDVKTHISGALQSLKQVQQAKKDVQPRSVAVPLGVLAQTAGGSARGGAVNASRADASRTGLALPGVRRTAGQQGRRLGIIKESFVVEVPYPVPSEQVFLLRAEPQLLLASMPLRRESLAASGVSTGGKPLVRVPFVDLKGTWLAGPSPSNVAWGQVASLVEKDDLKPLAAP